MAEREERTWFDISVRRPNDEEVDTSGELPPPAETYVSTFARDDGNDDIKLVLEGYHATSDQAMISSGLSTWEASELLCKYLLANSDGILDEPSTRLLELGSGLGKCGLLAHHLSPQKRGGRYYTIGETVLTDGDTNVMKLLQKNVSRNTVPTDETITCQQLIWGSREDARELMSSTNYREKFDVIIGADLIYTSRDYIAPLFETVDELIEGRGEFILAHNEAHQVRVTNIIKAAAKVKFFHEVLAREGQVYIICFRPVGVWNVNTVVDRLQCRNNMLEEEIKALKSSKSNLEKKCRSLEDRCTILSDDENLPTSILLSFGDDSLANIASYLNAKELDSLTLTCKHFGHSAHKNGTELTSLIQRLALKLFEGRSSSEKASLPLYEPGRPPLFFYNELLELRKPLSFDKLFGYALDYPFRGTKATIVKSNVSAYIKMSPGSLWAHTAVSNHVMRAGKHYATFTCSNVGGQLLFGIVRPLQKLECRPAFSPFCRNRAYDLLGLRIDEWTECDTHCCVYVAGSGKCNWTNWDGDRAYDSDDSDGSGTIPSAGWQGMQRFEGGTIGMLLDYNEGGSLTVFKNGVKLGVMKRGFSGTYSWMVSVGDWFCDTSHDGIAIERDTPRDSMKRPI